MQAERASGVVHPAVVAGVRCVRQGAGELGEVLVVELTQGLARDQADRGSVPSADPGSSEGARHTAWMPFLQLIAIVVDDYDLAISFFVGALGFELVEDTPSMTNAGNPKRWVVVRPPGAQTGILLARADGDNQSAVVGKQAAGRVGFFLQTDDIEAAYQRMNDAGVRFLTSPRTESYGRVAVFLDVAGNRWDLLGPP